ncbi:MAG: hypothetical protein ACOC8E_01365 [Planctomycetota bacterium]
MGDSPFPDAKWIWSPNHLQNHYALFVKDIELSRKASEIEALITASYHYELFINGEFVVRGPVHGDPKWCLYDRVKHSLDGTKTVQIAVVVYHWSDTYVHYQIPAPGGLLAQFKAGKTMVGTDETWKCIDLDMWSQAVPERGWALPYCEDYDARFEPEGWDRKIFPRYATEVWDDAVLVEGADEIWQNYQERMTPYLRRKFVRPKRFRAWHVAHEGARHIGNVSRICDTEPLELVIEWSSFDLGAANALLSQGNAMTFDLGRERVGFYTIDIDAPPETVIELSGAELLQGDRPWIFRKGTRNSARFISRGGRRDFTTFAWTGLRYLHMVIRGDAGKCRMHRVGCIERTAPIRARKKAKTRDSKLRRVFNICRHTLEISPQEHLVDCPTREQTQYWADGLFFAESLWAGFGERSYLEWYLECFLHAPFNKHGQLFGQYPGGNRTFLDFSLIPVLGQRFYKDETGEYYKPEETLEKALQLKKWYDQHMSKEGLVSFRVKSASAKGLINFIDHPGLGWHNFPHPGVDRKGTSCPLNMFYYGFVETLSRIARSLKHEAADALKEEAEHLKEAIREEFFDGKVFHDTKRRTKRSEGTSWQANGLAVYFDIVTKAKAKKILKRMLDGYDELCRCSPYFYFYFLPALARADMMREARGLIKDEWGKMLDGGATAAWETFSGDAMDSLCHPSSTAPFLFLIS